MTIQITHPDSNDLPSIRLTGEAFDSKFERRVEYDVVVPCAIAYGYEQAASRQLGRYAEMQNDSPRRFSVLTAQKSDTPF